MVARAAAFVSSAALVAAASAPSPPPAPLRMLRCRWRGDGGDVGGIEPVHDAPDGAPPSGNAKMRSTPSRYDGVEHRLASVAAAAAATALPCAVKTCNLVEGKGRPV